MNRIIAIAFLLLTQIGWALNNNRTLSDRAVVSVLTCGTGSELYSLFGHTAIRVYDPFEGIDRVYNYGMFDFETPNFYGRFVKGDLLYFVDYTNYENFVRSYFYENRSIVEQVLNLNQLQKQQVWDALNQALEESNKYYTYKFIDQNCTTKVVDVINSVIDQPVKVDIPGNTATYRTILNTYLSDRYFEKLGINLIFGNKVDQSAQSLFLPDKFEEGLRLSTNSNQPLVKEEVKVYSPEKSEGFVWWNTYVFALVCTFVLAIGVKTKVGRNIFFIVAGVFGMFFFGAGFYSLHSELLNNNVVFLLNPLLIVLPFIRKRLNTIIFAVYGAVLLLYVGLNITSEKLLITMPIILLMTFALVIEYKEKAKINK